VDCSNGRWKEEAEIAGNAQIGALHVKLGLDSAQFTTGLKGAQSSLSNFGSIAARGFTALAAAATVAAGALGYAVKGAIDHADALGKAAQKAGVAVEALSRLEYAAKLSDVSLEGLTGGLQKLSKTMVEAAQDGGSKAASAFAALGISVKDSAGNLRDADEAFVDIADKFSKVEDGAAKTAISMALLGKSGAELIPLLNAGRDGLKQMADESDRLGATIDGKTARGAEKFNDTLTTVQATLQGVVNKVMAAALPALQRLADLLASPEFASAATQLGSTIVTAMTEITAAVTLAINTLAQFGADFQKWGGFALQVVRGDFAGAINGLQISDLKKKAADNAASWDGVGFRQPLEITIPGGGGNKEGDAPGTPLDLGSFGADLKKAQEYLDPFAARIDELSGVLTATVDPFEQMKLDLTDLGTMLEHGAITAEQYGTAVSKTYWNMASSIAGALSQVTGVLADAFKDNKAFALANVAVSTAAGAMKAFEQGGIFGWLGAGAIIAQGAFQAANILSAEPGNSAAPSLGGGAGGAAAAVQQQSAINLTIRGSGNINVDDFADQLTQSIADGGNQNLVKVIRAA
jgi:hypothetical protein